MLVADNVLVGVAVDVGDGVTVFECVEVREPVRDAERVGVNVGIGVSVCVAVGVRV